MATTPQRQQVKVFNWDISEAEAESILFETDEEILETTAEHPVYYPYQVFSFDLHAKALLNELDDRVHCGIDLCHGKELFINQLPTLHEKTINTDRLIPPSGFDCRPRNSSTQLSPRTCTKRTPQQSASRFHDGKESKTSSTIPCGRVPNNQWRFLHLHCRWCIRRLSSPLSKLTIDGVTVVLDGSKDFPLRVSLGWKSQPPFTSTERMVLVRLYRPYAELRVSVQFSY